MKNELRHAFALVLCAGMLSATVPAMQAQNTTDQDSTKTANEKDAANKNAASQATPTPKANQNASRSGEHPPARGRDLVFSPATLKPVSALITLNMSDQSRAIYEAIGKQAGVNVLFDSDYTSRPISVQFNGVSFSDAMATMAFQARAFWRPVTSDTIFVAPDTQVKRMELEESTMKVYYLPNSTQPTEVQDIVNALRNILELRYVFPVNSAGVIIVRGTPDQQTFAEQIIRELDQARKRFGASYRLNFTVSTREGNKTVASRKVSLLLEPHELGRLHTGMKSPAQQPAEPAAKPDGKEAQTSVVERGIDCQVRSETEHAIDLSVDGDFSNLIPRSPAGGDAGAFKDLRLNVRTTVELDKPTELSSVDDASNRTYQVEVTATRIKSEE